MSESLSPLSSRSLRLPEETDEAFRQRAERAAIIAKRLVEACMKNRCMQRFMNDPALPYSEESVRHSPTVRLEYQEAIAFGGLGECWDATRSKHWGAGPWVMPLRPDDEFFPHRITYI